MYIPNSGFTSMFGVAYQMMVKSVIQEWKEKPVRINQVCTIQNL